MPTVSDYVVLADAVTTLRIGGDIDQTYQFSIPSNLNTGRQAIAAWQLEVEDPNDLLWRMTVNGTEIIRFTHGINRFGAVQEVFGGTVLRVGANQAQVTVLSGQGQIKISDVVIHYKADV